MYDIQANGRQFFVERAARDDVPALVALLADDALGAGRDGGELPAYLRAFDEIDADPRHFLAAVRDAAGNVVGTLQLTLIPGLARGGATRLQIEAVRIAEAVRGSGLGEALFEWAHEYGRAHGAALVQLTSDKQRVDAHRFYERLGYEATHEGFKRTLESQPQSGAG